MPHPWQTFRSDITTQSTIKIFPHKELQLKNGRILINPLKAAKTPKMGLISIFNENKTEQAVQSYAAGKDYSGSIAKN